MKLKCLILGGGGFIGSHLCDELIEKGYSVTVFDKLNFTPKNISHLGSKIKIIEGDFLNEKDLKNALNGIDIVFHLVSSTVPASSNDNPVYDIETNLIPTLHLLNECLKQKIKKVIFLSSGGTVYGIPKSLPLKETDIGKPICSYGIMKKTIEDYLFMYHRLYGLDYSVFRLSNPYGERQNPFFVQGVISVFLYKLITGQPIEIWGDGNIIRDFIYIKDVVNVIVDSIDRPKKDKVFNLGSGTGHRLTEIAEIMQEVSGLKMNIVFNEQRTIDVPVNVLDNTLIKKSFHWKPVVGIYEGITRTYLFLKSELKDIK